MTPPSPAPLVPSQPSLLLQKLLLVLLLVLKTIFNTFIIVILLIKQPAENLWGHRTQSKQVFGHVSTHRLIDGIDRMLGMILTGQYIVFTPKVELKT